MSHSTPTRPRFQPGAIGAVVLLGLLYALLLAFIWLVGTAPLIAGVVAVLVGLALTVAYIRLGQNR
ncbi:hypothetical protein M3D75_02990 [Microbacterium enclense]|uniref:hypothetical protein n=1 Tax=Microbacterium enclense TaxID=993073 RepID=UPI0021A7614C|nr:hypothetical protein [Microbacterium enclense]MCT2085073.1 hypothetical protein [Microbacterium enclense]